MVHQIKMKLVIVPISYINTDGGIETDLTIVLDKDYFRIISSAATRERDKPY